jgi:rhamnogalacturonan endolyase
MFKNDGSSADAALRARSESIQYPYSWFDNKAYQARGVVSGRIILSDGRPANGAAVFLGDVSFYCVPNDKYAFANLTSPEPP